MANVALVDGLLAPRRDLGRFVRRQLLRDEGRDALARPAVHLGKQVARHAIAFAGLRRGRAWSPLPALPPYAGTQALRAQH
jgi:hypothetical protein